MNKKIILGMVIFLSMLSIASAYRLVCLGYGESYPAGDRKCLHDICQVCMTNDYKQAHSSHCNDIGACELLNGTNVDGKAPIITLKSPLDNKVYSSASILLDFKSDEPCSLTYTDNINGRGRWKKVCTNCQSYSKSRRFEEGLNNITIKCVDKHGNKAEVVRTFRVDSKEGKITKTFPAKGFADGKFEAQFEEENPSSFVLNYGTYNLIRKKSLNLASDCTEENGKYACDITVNLKEFDGKEIEYWFELKDVANHTTVSNRVSLQVDATLPVLNNQANFWTQGTGKDNKYIYFNLNVTENNFNEVIYYDSSDSNLRWKRLCGNLKGGFCSTKKSFKVGNHAVDIQIIDDAGNSISKRISFLVNA